MFPRTRMITSVRNEYLPIHASYPRYIFLNDHVATNRTQNPRPTAINWCGQSENILDTMAASVLGVRPQFGSNDAVVSKKWLPRMCLDGVRKSVFCSLSSGANVPWTSSKLPERRSGHSTRSTEGPCSHVKSNISSRDELLQAEWKEYIEQEVWRLSTIRIWSQ